VQFDGQDLPLIIGSQIGRRHQNAAHRRAFVVAALEVLAELSGQRTLGPVGDHLDRIDKVLTFRTQLAVTFGFRQLLELDLARDLPAFFLPSFEQRGLDADPLAQLLTALGEGRDPLRAEGVRQGVRGQLHL